VKESARAQINAPLFSFFLLCATQSKRRKKERKREEQTNTLFHSLSLSFSARVFARDPLSPEQRRLRVSGSSSPSSFFPKVKHPIFFLLQKA